MASKKAYGEFQNVLLKDEERAKLIGRIGEKNTGILVEELSQYMESRGKKYSSHYATLLVWAKRRVQEVSKNTGKYQLTTVH